MKNYRLGKWTAFCAVAAVVAASGQACPPEMPVPTPSLTGVWTGPISGEATLSVKRNNTNPPGTGTGEGTFQTAGTVQIVFDDTLRLVALPLQSSAFFGGFFEQAVTVFNVGETQTVANSFKSTFPSGMDTFTNESSFTTTRTVIESVISADHFRVVYETTELNTFSQTSSDPMSMAISDTSSSTGTLTLDATLVNGQVMFSADFNINGSSEAISGTTTTQTGNGFVVGSLTGTLSAN